MLNCRALAFLTGLALVCGIGVILTGLIPQPALQVAAGFFAGPPTPTLTLTSSPEATLIAIPMRTPAPAATRTPIPPPTLSQRRAPRSIVEHFPFGRPLAEDAPGPAPDWQYLYGTTEHTEYEVHHGVDFPNPFGTSVLAVADGTILSAGDDRDPLCGENGTEVCRRFLKFYGLVVVMRLDETLRVDSGQASRGETLYALYGHLDRIDVQVGQVVKRGVPIGKVGMTGIAIGPHTQFEIRLGANDYASTRNPMLWIRPLPGRGVLAGRYTDQKDNFIHAATIDIYRADAPEVLYRETETYSRDNQPDVNSDDELGENFLMNDLPAGDYIVRVVGKAYQRRVTVQAGSLTFLELGGS